MSERTGRTGRANRADGADEQGGRAPLDVRRIATQGDPRSSPAMTRETSPENPDLTTFLGRFGGVCRNF